jgi:hypothetical protein
VILSILVDAVIPSRIARFSLVIYVFELHINRIITKIGDLEPGIPFRAHTRPVNGVFCV